MMPIMMGQFKVVLVPSHLIYRFSSGRELWSKPKVEIVEWRYCKFGTNYQPEIVKVIKLPA